MMKTENQESQTITSITSFLEALNNIDADDYFKKEYFFRGHANNSWEPIPSIYRHKNWIKNEELMIKDLISRCPNDFQDHKYTFQSLVKMQHYSLPTRLLDVTTNPLVALYFACQPDEPKHSNHKEEGQVDGEVMVFCTYKDLIKYHDSDTVSVISNLAKVPQSFDITEYPISEKETNAFNAMQKIKILLHEIRHEKPHFEARILRGHLECVVFVRPLLDNPRIIKQEGAFILFGIDGKKTNPAKINESLSQKAKIPRLLVPAKSKNTILRELEVLGVSDSTVFPEIDNVAKYIKANYIKQ